MNVLSWIDSSVYSNTSIQDQALQKIMTIEDLDQENLCDKLESLILEQVEPKSDLYYALYHLVHRHKVNTISGYEAKGKTKGILEEHLKESLCKRLIGGETIFVREELSSKIIKQDGSEEHYRTLFEEAEREGRVFNGQDQSLKNTLNNMVRDNKIVLPEHLQDGYGFVGVRNTMGFMVQHNAKIETVKWHKEGVKFMHKLVKLRPKMTSK